MRAHLRPLCHVPLPIVVRPGVGPRVVEVREYVARHRNLQRGRNPRAAAGGCALRGRSARGAPTPELRVRDRSGAAGLRLPKQDRRCRLRLAAERADRLQVLPEHLPPLADHAPLADALQRPAGIGQRREAEHAGRAGERLRREAKPVAFPRRGVAASASTRASPCARRSETSRKVATILGSPARASGMRRTTPSTRIQPRASFRARCSHGASAWPRDSLRVAAESWPRSSGWTESTSRIAPSSSEHGVEEALGGRRDVRAPAVVVTEPDQCAGVLRRQAEARLDVDHGALGLAQVGHVHDRSEDRRRGPGRVLLAQAAADDVAKAAVGRDDAGREGIALAGRVRDVARRPRGRRDGRTRAPRRGRAARSGRAEARPVTPSAAYRDASRGLAEPGGCATPDCQRRLSCGRADEAMQLLIVDDHPLFREALASTIGLSYPDAVLHEADGIAAPAPAGRAPRHRADAPRPVDAGRAGLRRPPHHPRPRRACRSWWSPATRTRASCARRCTTAPPASCPRRSTRRR